MVEVERGDLTRRYKIGGNENMANLKDVKVIDMEDGNVTKIEYDGKEYEKVSEGTSPKKGDIGLRVKVSLPHMMDVTEGEYYEINMGAGDYENKGEVGYVDDEGDSVFTSYETNFIYFRENSDYSEMSKDGLSVGDTVILDAGDAADEYPLHGFYNGEEYEVTNLHPDHGVEGAIRIEGGSAYGLGYALPSQLRKKGDFKEGDRVRINIPEGKTPEYHWGAASNGDVGTVVEVCEHKVVVNFPEQSYWNALPSELELITIDEYEEATEKDAPFKPGDIVEVIGRTRFDDIKVGTKARVRKGSDGDGEYRIDLLDGSDHDYVTPENIELFEFKVGDKAKVIGKTYFSDIDEGTTVVITEEQDRAGDYRIDLLDESDFDYVQPESLEPIAEDATDELESLIGKYAVFSDRSFQSDLITGKYYEIVDICVVDKDGFYVVDEAGDRQFVFQDANKSRFTYEIHDDKPHIEVGDLVEVVDSPMAQPEGTRFVVKEVEELAENTVVTDGKGFIYRAKKHVKLIEKAGEVSAKATKADRDPGEIRLGDIVRVDRDIVSFHNEGDIGIVTEYDDNGSFRVETPTLDHSNWVGSRDVTLLAKVEDRVDKHAFK